VQDHELIERIKAGDSQAFKNLYERHKDLVVNLCYRLVFNKEVAEDITQDVFLKIYKSAKSFRHRSKLSTWIYRITVNLCLNHFRKEKQFNWFLPDNPVKQANMEAPFILPDSSGNQPDLFF